MVFQQFFIFRNFALKHFFRCQFNCVTYILKMINYIIFIGIFTTRGSRVQGLGCWLLLLNRVVKYVI